MRFSPLKKKVKTYNNRQQIHLNKSDEYHDEYAWIYTTKEQQDLMSEMESLRMKIDEIKQSDDDKSEIIKDYQSRYQSSLDEVRQDIRQEYESEIRQLQDEIKSNQEMIRNLQQDIKEYQDMIKDYEDKSSNHNKEINDHKAVIYDVSNKYNSLRIAIKGTSRLDVFLNRHKKLLDDYPEMTLSTDNTVDVNVSDNLVNKQD